MSDQRPPNGPWSNDPQSQSGWGQQGPQQGPQQGWGQPGQQGPQQGWGQQGPQQGWGQQQPEWQQGQQGAQPGPQQGWGQQQPDWQQPQWQQPGAGSSGWGPGEPPRKSRKGLWIGGAAAATALVLVGGGVFAFNSVLGGGGAQPAEAVPDSAMAYVRVDLDPSAGQKINILRLLRKVPDFADETGIDDEDADLRRVLFEQTVGKEDCDLDYEQDVEPWIGDRAALAALPGGDEPTALAVLQVSDTDAAEEGVKKLEACAEQSGEDEEGGYAFSGDYLLYSDSTDAAQKAARDAEQSPLTENEQFSADMDELGEQGVLSAWTDVEGLVQAFGDEDDAKSLRDLGFTSGAAALRAGSDHIEVAATTRQPDAPTTDQRSQVGQLPAETVLGLGFAGGDEAVDKGWQSLQEALGEEGLDSSLGEIESATGLTLPDDAATLLGENFTLGIGEGGLADIAGLSDPSDLSRLQVGFRSTGDGAAIQSVVDDLNRLIAQTGGPALSTEEADGGLVVSTNDDWASQLAQEGSLGQSDRFSTVVPDEENATGVFYLDVDKVTGVAQQIASSQGESTDFVKYLEPIEAVGVSVQAPDGDYVSSTLRVSFD